MADARLEVVIEAVDRASTVLAQAQRSLAQTAESFKRSGKIIQEAGRDLTTWVTAPMLAVGAAAVLTAGRVGNLANELADLSAATSLNVDTLQEFRHAAVQAGTEVDAMSDAARLFLRRLDDIAAGDASAVESFKQLGVSVTDSSGHLRSMNDLFPEVISALAGMGDATQRSVIGANLFGLSWARLAPVVALGAEGIARARTEAHEMGLVLSGDSLKAAEAYRQQMSSLGEQFGAVGTTLGQALMPLLMKFAAFLQNSVIPALAKAASGMSALAAAFEALPGPVQAAIGTLAAIAVIAGPTIWAIGGIARALAALVGVVAATTGVIAALATGPVGIAALAIGVVGAIGIIKTLSDEIDKAMKQAEVAAKTGSDAISKTLSEGAKGSTKSWKDEFENTLGRIDESMGESAETWQKAWDAAGGHWRDFLDTWKDEFENTLGRADHQFGETADEWVQALKDAQVELDKLEAARRAAEDRQAEMRIGGGEEERVGRAQGAIDALAARLGINPADFANEEDLTAALVNAAGGQMVNGMPAAEGIRGMFLERSRAGQALGRRMFIAGGGVVPGEAGGPPLFPGLMPPSVINVQVVMDGRVVAESMGMRAENEEQVRSS